MRRLLLLCILFLTVGFAEVMPMDKRLVSGVLPNGLRYMIMHNEKPAKMAEFRLMVKAGSLDEEEGQRGLAHFTEHMAFNGTKYFKKNALVSLRQIIRELESTQQPVRSPFIMNGSGFGMFANHSLVMASYISRANAALIDLRQLLQQG